MSAIPAKTSSRCPGCNAAIVPGDLIVEAPGVPGLCSGRWWHQDCAPASEGDPLTDALLRLGVPAERIESVGAPALAAEIREGTDRFLTGLHGLAPAPTQAERLRMLAAFLEETTGRPRF